MQAHLSALGCERVPEDPNLWRRVTKRGTLFMAVTIDYFTVTFDSSRMYRDPIAHICIKYQAKDLGPPSHMLGWSIIQDPTTKEVFVAQPHLAQAFVSMAGMHTARPARTPYIFSISLASAGPTETIIHVNRYQRALRILRYMVDSTRPDLAVSACHLARHLARPTRRHWMALAQVAGHV